jgi:hypothetical protein
MVWMSQGRESTEENVCVQPSDAGPNKSTEMALHVSKAVANQTMSSFRILMGAIKHQSIGGGSLLCIPRVAYTAVPSRSFGPSPRKLLGQHCRLLVKTSRFVDTRDAAGTPTA